MFAVKKNAGARLFPAIDGYNAHWATPHTEFMRKVYAGIAGPKVLSPEDLARIARSPLASIPHWPVNSLADTPMEEMTHEALSRLTHERGREVFAVQLMNGRDLLPDAKFWDETMRDERGAPTPTPALKVLSLLVDAAQQFNERVLGDGEVVDSRTALSKSMRSVWNDDRAGGPRFNPTKNVRVYIETLWGRQLTMDLNGNMVPADPQPRYADTDIDMRTHTWSELTKYAGEPIGYRLVFFNDTDIPFWRAVWCVLQKNSVPELRRPIYGSDPTSLANMSKDVTLSSFNGLMEDYARQVLGTSLSDYSEDRRVGRAGDMVDPAQVLDLFALLKAPRSEHVRENSVPAQFDIDHYNLTPEMARPFDGADRYAVWTFPYASAVSKIGFTELNERFFSYAFPLVQLYQVTPYAYDQEARALDKLRNASAAMAGIDAKAAASTADISSEDLYVKDGREMTVEEIKEEIARIGVGTLPPAAEEQSRAAELQALLRRVGVPANSFDQIRPDEMQNMTPMELFDEIERRRRARLLLPFNVQPKLNRTLTPVDWFAPSEDLLAILSDPEKRAMKTGALEQLKTAVTRFVHENPVTPDEAAGVSAVEAMKNRAQALRMLMMGYKRVCRAPASDLTEVSRIFNMRLLDPEFTETRYPVDILKPVAPGMTHCENLYANYISEFEKLFGVANNHSAAFALLISALNALEYSTKDHCHTMFKGPPETSKSFLLRLIRELLTKGTSVYFDTFSPKAFTGRRGQSDPTKQNFLVVLINETPQSFFESANAPRGGGGTGVSNPGDMENAIKGMLSEYAINHTVLDIDKDGNRLQTDIQKEFVATWFFTTNATQIPNTLRSRMDIRDLMKFERPGASIAAYEEYLASMSDSERGRRESFVRWNQKVQTIFYHIQMLIYVSAGLLPEPTTWCTFQLVSEARDVYAREIPADAAGKLRYWNRLLSFSRSLTLFVAIDKYYGPGGEGFGKDFEIDHVPEILLLAFDSTRLALMAFGLTSEGTDHRHTFTRFVSVLGGLASQQRLYFAQKFEMKNAGPQEPDVPEAPDDLATAHPGKSVDPLTGALDAMVSACTEPAEHFAIVQSFIDTDGDLSLDVVRRLWLARCYQLDAQKRWGTARTEQYVEWIALKHLSLIDTKFTRAQLANSKYRIPGDSLDNILSKHAATEANTYGRGRSGVRHDLDTDVTYITLHRGATTAEQYLQSVCNMMPRESGVVSIPQLISMFSEVMIPLPDLIVTSVRQPGGALSMDPMAIAAKLRNRLAVSEVNKSVRIQEVEGSRKMRHAFQVIRGGLNGENINEIRMHTSLYNGPEDCVPIDPFRLVVQAMSSEKAPKCTFLTGRGMSGAPTLGERQEIKPVPGKKICRLNLRYDPLRCEGKPLRVIDVNPDHMSASTHTTKMQLGVSAALITRLMEEPLADRCREWYRANGKLPSNFDRVVYPDTLYQALKHRDQLYRAYTHAGTRAGSMPMDLTSADAACVSDEIRAKELETQAMFLEIASYNGASEGGAADQDSSKAPRGAAIVPSYFQYALRMSLPGAQEPALDGQSIIDIDNKSRPPPSYQDSEDASFLGHRSSRPSAGDSGGDADYPVVRSTRMRFDDEDGGPAHMQGDGGHPGGFAPLPLILMPSDRPMSSRRFGNQSMHNMQGVNYEMPCGPAASRRDVFKTFGHGAASTSSVPSTAARAGGRRRKRQRTYADEDPKPTSDTVVMLGTSATDRELSRAAENLRQLGFDDLDADWEM